MALAGSHIIDARTVVLVILPSEKPIKVIDGLGKIQERAGISGRLFEGPAVQLHKGIVVGGSRACKELGRLMDLKRLFDRFGCHLAAPVIHNFRALGFEKNQDVFDKQPAFDESLGLRDPLMPTDHPIDGFTRIFVQQVAQIEKQPFFEGRQKADIPAP